MLAGVKRSFTQVRFSGLASLKNLQRKRKEEADLKSDSEGHAGSSSDPWMYKVLNEETLGMNRIYVCDGFLIADHTSGSNNIIK